MSNVNPILLPIIKSAQLPEHLDELVSYWESEKKKRIDFYNWVTPGIKAEFIDGEVLVHSPVRSKHNVISQRIILEILTLLNNDKIEGYLGFEKVMCRFPRNDYEPDIVFFDKDKAENISDDTTIFPVPDFIVEVTSKSTEHIDRGVKLQDYQANGVLEYWIVDSYQSSIQQYSKNDGKYRMKEYFHNDQIVSSTITGLALSLTKLFK